MKYDKLVRDRIPVFIESKGLKPVIHIANEEEYQAKLMEKLTEEVNEFLEDNNMEEFIDILEVMDAIAEYKRFSKEDVKRLKDEKAENRGRFSKRIILDETN